mgnify:CR=1 FL=1|tara:strand:- start:1460 stop:3466 length:2007 start_codon:yes stop_codon:yes gene_type:complete
MDKPLMTRPKARPNLKNGETTPGGRPVWKDKDTGEAYSERTTTFDVDGIWYTMPTVADDGSQYSDESVRAYVVENGPVDFITGEELPTFSSQKEAVDYAKNRSDTRRPNQEATGFAQGGVTKMKNKYDEGGLATDGLAIDPVSGNDIPLGSNAEDVRDDVDAKLSSGEYVVPADVVKYVGVAQLEKLVNKAKAGLEDMGENGRIGGEPVGEAEEVVMTLGGDLNTLDGYATGGMVPGTDIDGIINRVKAAAMKDPSIINMLKAKGVFIEEPQPQGQAQQAAMSQGAVPKQAAPPSMQGQNNPAAFAEGGMVQPSASTGFNPYAFAPGFSIETGTTGQAPAVSGMAPPPGPNGQTCSPGYAWDSSKGMCVPTNTDYTPATGSPQSNNENGTSDNKPSPPVDPNNWMSKFDYSDPKTLTSETMTSLGFEDPDAKPKKIGFLEAITSGIMKNMAGGLLGKAMAVNNVAEANANAAILRSKGLVAEADKIQAQVSIYEEEKGITGWPTGMRNGEGMAARAMESDNASKWSNWGTAAAVAKEATAGAGAPDDTVTPTTTAPLGSGITPSNNNNHGGDPSSGLSNHAHIASVAQNDGATAGQANSIASDFVTAGITEGNADSTKEDDTTAGGASLDTAYGISGLNKGGFIAPRPKTKTATKAKKKTNKKGLGQR